jgi:cation diffusion facilitator family transporter
MILAWIWPFPPGTAQCPNGLRLSKGFCSVHTGAVMQDCCEIRADVPRHQRRVLGIVLGINVTMFLIEFAGGLMARSTALLADSVDMLGDAIVYGFSLYVVGRGAAWQARAALLKGAIMAAFGVGVLLEAGLKLTQGLVPQAELMGGVGILALAANGSVLLFLWRRRADDINMRSAWLCSRNDVMANLGVLLAAAGVALSGAAWPDILVGLSIAALFATSAVEVIRSARRELA